MRIDPILAHLKSSRATRLLRRATWLVPRALTRRVGRGWATLRRLWRRSLQFRVVAITLLVSVTLVAAFGLSVAKLITDRVLDSKSKSSRQYVEQGAQKAVEQLGAFAQSDDPGLQAALKPLVSALSSTVDPNNTVDVVILRTRAPFELPPEKVAWPDPKAYNDMLSPDLVRLRKAVNGTGGSQPGVYQQYTTVDGEKYLVIGSKVPAGSGDMELYYLFPLKTQEELAAQVSIVVLATGAVLTALLTLLAGLMTRLVVQPVRVAARTAQRLSAGLLDQRIQVRGEDDLARLAAAFNQMAANLQRQIVRLEEMSRLQRRFTSDVSHELRTPLTTVRMAADLLFSSREDFEPAAARSAELLQTELDRFESLLTDLLEISRFDAGFAALDAEPTDLVPVVQRVGDRLSGLAERCGVVLRLDLPEAPAIAEVDARRVERILRNLLGNAVEHGEQRPVLVTLAMDESSVAVTVRDHGIGLKSGEEKLVFNRFWRADPSRARQTGGTGLGLSISLEDARLHGGWLEAWGAPDKGAQFRLTLPARAGDRLVSSPLRLVPDDARADESTFLEVVPVHADGADSADEKAKETL